MAIHIKKENKGKFTAYKERTGKTTEEALNSSDPHIRKMANFANNARKWNHKKNGGTLKEYAIGGGIDPTISNNGSSASKANGNGVGSNLGGLWGTLAGVGTAVSATERGNTLTNPVTGQQNGSTFEKNQAANVTNPFNQFQGNKDIADWGRSFLDPLGSNIMKAKRQTADYTKEKAQQDQQSIVAGEDRYNQALQQGFNPQGNKDAFYYKNGGTLKQLSSDNELVQGNSHANGGVKLPEVGAEVEGGETINKDFVFSKELGFAQKHKPIANAIGKIEKKPENRFTHGSLERLKEREESLKVEQEKTKQQLGISNDLDMKKYGGKTLKEYGGGGTIKFTSEELAEVNKAKVDPNNPNAYKETVHKIVGLNPKKYPAGSQSSKEEEERYDRRVRGFNNGIKPIIKEKNGKLISGFKDKDEYKNGGTLKQYDDGGNLTYDQRYNRGLNYNDPNSEDVNFTTDTNTSKNLFDNGVNKTNNNSLSTSFNSMAPYADNIGNAIINYQRSKMPIPQEALVNKVKGEHVNYDASRAEADRERRGLNLSIDQSSSNAAVNNSNKIAALTQTIRAKNEVNQNEKNTNVSIDNNTAQFNSGIERNNNATTLNNQLRKYGVKDDLYRESSMNLANATGKYNMSQDVNAARQTGKLQTLADLASADPKNVEYLRSKYPELFKKYGGSINAGSRRDTRLGKLMAA